MQGSEKHHISVHGRLMRVQIRGRWDDQAISDLHADLEKVVPRFDGEPFACIWDVTEFEQLTPQSEALVREMISWLISRGLCKDADVSLQQDNHIQQQLEAVQPVADPQEYEHRLFRSEADARAWLGGYGFC